MSDITNWKQLKAIKRKTIFARDAADGTKLMNAIIHDRGRKISYGDVNYGTVMMADMPDEGPIFDGETWIDLYAPLRTR